VNAEFKDFYDAIGALIAGDTEHVPELTAGSVVVMAPDASAADIDTEVQKRVAAAKGLVVVIYRGRGENVDPDEDLDDTLAIGVEMPMELYANRHRWNWRKDASKRATEVLLVSLIRLVHGAQVEPANMPSYERVRFRRFYPVNDDDFEVWRLEFDRTLFL